MRILIIEDDPALARGLELKLLHHDFVVEVARCGEEGRDFAELYPYDLIVLDLGLPDVSGLELLRDLRRNKVGTPVLVLTGADALESKVKAFSAGADDYLLKPFQAEELIARVRAVVRRSQGVAQSVLQVGDLTIDMDSKLVQAGERRVAVTGREYQVLELLLLRRGKMQSKEALLGALYGGLDVPGHKIIDVFICKLRKKLQEAGSGTQIETVWGGGYMVRDGVQPATAAA